MDGSDPRLPTANDIADAARRLEGVAVRTPLLEAPVLSEALGFRLLVKAECLQVTGSFKLRGAFNKIARLPAARRAQGVVTFSSGNHAQAVAYVARRFGVPATIVMPNDAPHTKVAGTTALGARIVRYDRQTEHREEVAAGIAAETGAELVPPYDDAEIIAGQGTVGREIMADLSGAPPDAVLVPCGGGGLTSGCALAVKAARGDTEVFAVEPAGFDDLARSLVAGRRESNPPGGHSICDALLVASPGELTFAILRLTLSGAFQATDDRTLDAMATAFRHFKLVVEPGGAVALAAALAERERFGGRTVVAVLSGGNVDADLYTRALARDADDVSGAARAGG